MEPVPLALRGRRRSRRRPSRADPRLRFPGIRAAARDALRQRTALCSTGAAGLTRLSVWWLQLGIRLERIEPGEPQQNGRLERAHLTLEEIVSTPAEDAYAQQRQLDPWRREYNEERPHEALGQR